MHRYVIWQEGGGTSSEVVADTPRQAVRKVSVHAEHGIVHVKGPTKHHRYSLEGGGPLSWLGEGKGVTWNADQIKFLGVWRRTRTGFMGSADKLSLEHMNKKSAVFQVIPNNGFPAEFTKKLKRQPSSRGLVFIMVTLTPELENTLSDTLNTTIVWDEMNDTERLTKLINTNTDGIVVHSATDLPLDEGKIELQVLNVLKSRNDGRKLIRMQKDKLWEVSKIQYDMYRELRLHTGKDKSDRIQQLIGDKKKLEDDLAHVRDQLNSCQASSKQVIQQVIEIVQQQSVQHTTETLAKRVVQPITKIKYQQIMKDQKKKRSTGFGIAQGLLQGETTALGTTTTDDRNIKCYDFRPLLEYEGQEIIQEHTFTYLKDAASQIIPQLTVQPIPILHVYRDGKIVLRCTSLDGLSISEHNNSPITVAEVQEALQNDVVAVKGREVTDENGTSYGKIEAIKAIHPDNTAVTVEEVGIYDLQKINRGDYADWGFQVNVTLTGNDQLESGKIYSISQPSNEVDVSRVVGYVNSRTENGMCEVTFHIPTRTSEGYYVPLLVDGTFLPRKDLHEFDFDNNDFYKVVMNVPDDSLNAITETETLDLYLGSGIKHSSILGQYFLTDTDSITVKLDKDKLKSATSSESRQTILESIKKLYTERDKHDTTTFDQLLKDLNQKEGMSMILRRLDSPQKIFEPLMQTQCRWKTQEELDTMMDKLAQQERYHFLVASSRKATLKKVEQDWTLKLDGLQDGNGKPIVKEVTYNMYTKDDRHHQFQLAGQCTFKRYFQQQTRRDEIYGEGYTKYSLEITNSFIPYEVNPHNNTLISVEWTNGQEPSEEVHIYFTEEQPISLDVDADIRVDEDMVAEARRASSRAKKELQEAKENLKRVRQEPTVAQEKKLLLARVRKRASSVQKAGQAFLLPWGSREEEKALREAQSKLETAKNAYIKVLSVDPTLRVDGARRALERAESGSINATLAEQHTPAIVDSWSMSSQSDIEPKDFSHLIRKKWIKATTFYLKLSADLQQELLSWIESNPQTGDEEYGYYYPVMQQCFIWEDWLTYVTDKRDKITDKWKELTENIRHWDEEKQEYIRMAYSNSIQDAGGVMSLVRRPVWITGDNLKRYNKKTMFVQGMIDNSYLMPIGLDGSESIKEQEMKVQKKKGNIRGALVLTTAPKPHSRSQHTPIERGSLVTFPWNDWTTT